MSILFREEDWPAPADPRPITIALIDHLNAMKANGPSESVLHGEWVRSLPSHVLRIPADDFVTPTEFELRPKHADLSIGDRVIMGNRHAWKLVEVIAAARFDRRGWLRHYAYREAH